MNTETQKELQPAALFECRRSVDTNRLKRVFQSMYNEFVLSGLCEGEEDPEGKMKNVLGGRVWTIVGFTVASLVMIVMIVYALHFTSDTMKYDTQDALTEGTYSVDGGEWQSFQNGILRDKSFHRMVVRWTPESVDLQLWRNLNVSAKNVWFQLSTSDGEVLAERRYISREEHMENDPESSYSPEMDMRNTPGYTVRVVNLELFNDPEWMAEMGSPELILEVENPYEHEEMRFTDCVSVTYSMDNGFYILFFRDAMPGVLLFALVCFFGLFLFPVAGFILGKVDYRYLTFGALCFSWGIFMIGQKLSGYLNLWIEDPTVCLALLMMLKHFLVIAILFYMKSNLKRATGRMVANLTTTAYILAFLTVVVLHFTAVWDLYASADLMDICTAVGMLLIAALLFMEVKESKQALRMLISLVPLTLAMLLDALNGVFPFTEIHFYYFGLTITMLYQILRIVLDLRQQYKEAIRYQQMQKELYEAKVSVMVSQIQPHFMYNALSSIAMMCTIDPDTAQEATLTFAKYLRGNMDSLKTTAPVSFEQELEHLKKYLYIEKLRFDDLLTIEYDIQVTDFRIPLLSVQPLVENAVKHGVGMKQQGGTVTIATRETEEDFRVIVSDDGVGFDVNAARELQETKSDGRSHVGMENTKRRIAEMCGGSVVIESTPGEGTVATVILPKSGQRGGANENSVSG